MTRAKGKYINGFQMMMKATALIAEACRLVGPHSVRGILREYLALERSEKKAKARS